MGILTAFPGSHLGITMGFLVNLRLLCLRAQMAMLGRMAVLTILDRSCRSVGSQVARRGAMGQGFSQALVYLGMIFNDR